MKRRTGVTIILKLILQKYYHTCLESFVRRHTGVRIILKLILKKY